MVDLDSAAHHFAQFLTALGLENSEQLNIDESSKNTANLFAAWMNGLAESAPQMMLMATNSHDLVSLQNLPFYSFCAHHFVPFFGTIQIDYLPNQHIAGLGSFTRVIDHFSRRPQFQENLCAQIADYLFEVLQPIALRVHIQARQMCLELHGKGNQIEIGVSANRGDAALFKT